MKKCGECGSTDIKLADIKGQSFPWKDYSAVFITSSHEFYQCQNCKNVILKAGEAKILDHLIEESISDQIRIFIKMIVEREGCEQQELAHHVGVTPEYLSGIKQGRLPGFQTFNFLKTLAMAGHKTFEVSKPSFDVTKKIAG